MEHHQFYLRGAFTPDGLGDTVYAYKKKIPMELAAFQQRFIDVTAAVSREPIGIVVMRAPQRCGKTTAIIHAAARHASEHGDAVIVCSCDRQRTNVGEEIRRLTASSPSLSTVHTICAESALQWILCGGQGIPEDDPARRILLGGDIFVDEACMIRADTLFVIIKHCRHAYLAESRLGFPDKVLEVVNYGPRVTVIDVGIIITKSDQVSAH
jgi:hypothetical protein